MDEADRLSDRVAIIDNGRLLLTDTPENLKRTAGTGDVLEITIQATEGSTLQEAADAMRAFIPQVSLSGSTILIRERNAIEMIPFITEKLHARGLTCTEIKMRANTLEDVFIQLTGRRLREQ
jgi:ABC-2 type transport system ATP-binding protein